MNLEEAKAHMIAHDLDWSYYIKRMDSFSREKMAAEQKALMRDGKKVSTPRGFALAAQVSDGSEKAAEGKRLPSADPSPLSVEMDTRGYVKVKI